MTFALHRLLVLVWFLAYMSAIYLVLHIALARVVHNPDSRLLWFFSILTSPLIRPVRSLMPARTAESTLRYVTLAASIAIWLAARLLLGRMGGVTVG